MSSVNKVILIGRVGQEPEIRHFENSSVANLSLATSEKWTDKNGQKKRTPNGTLWRRGVN